MKWLHGTAKTILVVLAVVAAAAVFFFVTCLAVVLSDPHPLTIAP